MIDAIDDLPYNGDKCYEANAVCEKFKHSAMLGTFEHFQMMQIVKKVKGFANYEQTGAFFKSKWDSAAQNTPSIFKKLLNGETSDCKLINRFFNEPLYCTTGSYSDHGYRQIFTWMPKDDDSEDQQWSFNVPGGIHGVNIRNNYRTNQNWRYIFGAVIGSSDSLDKQTDYFRIDIIDDDYILLQPNSGKYK